MSKTPHRRPPRDNRWGWRCTECDAGSVVAIAPVRAAIVAAGHMRRTDHRIEVGPVRAAGSRS